MREVIIWPLRVWLLVFSLGLAIVISIGVVLSDVLLLISLAITFLAILFFGYKSRLVIEVSRDQLVAGRARIDRIYLGEIEVLDQKAMKFEMGAGIDPRAFFAIRFWVKAGVKVMLNDSRDPTPYWLISSRNPEAIKRALKKD